MFAVEESSTHQLIQQVCGINHRELVNEPEQSQILPKSDVETHNRIYCSSQTKSPHERNISYETFRDSPTGPQTLNSTSRESHEHDDLSMCESSCINHDLNHVKKERGKELAGVRSSTRGCRRHSTLLDQPSHKWRRTLHDMTKPLKSWLYDNRENPYPTKEEKLALAVSSEMTLTQVSNWFANARRRLKNTVRQPGLTWSKRTKLYNKQASHDAERPSVMSSWSVDDEAENMGTCDSHVVQQYPLIITQAKVEPCPPINNQSSSPITPSTVNVDTQRALRPPTPIDAFTAEMVHLHKFKQSILHRYLNDSIQHHRLEYQTGIHLIEEKTPPTMQMFNESGSIGSHDYEDVTSSSSNSSVRDGSRSLFRDGCYSYEVGIPGHYKSASQTHQSKDAMYQTSDAEETYWKEIIAAMVLTNMARAKRQQQTRL